MDFSKCPAVRGRAYNGANGKKIAVEFDGEVYMIKFPPVPTQKASEMSYTNSCFSEYICCHIFELAGIPVQKTMLGTYTVNGKEKIVCACKDFTDDDTTLFDFCSIKNTVIDSELHGKGTDLSEIIESINLQGYIMPKKLLEFFFDVFVVDALVGNFDRHNGNWGFLYNHRTKQYDIAPVYDCGSCLLPQADDEQIERIMSNRGEFNSRIYNFPLSAIYKDGKKINYYDFISSMECEECNRALLRIMPRLDIDKIKSIINETPYISDIQRSFYTALVDARYQKILAPAYKIQLDREMKEGQTEEFGSLDLQM